MPPYSIDVHHRLSMTLLLCLRMRKIKGYHSYEYPLYDAMTLGHVHTVMSHGDNDGGTRDSTRSVWKKDDWAPDLTDNHGLVSHFHERLAS